MSLKDIFDAVKADLTKDGVIASVLVGKDFPAREGDPLAGRVVFVMPRWQYGPAGANGGRTGGNPRPVASRAQVVEAHVWARAAEQSDPEAQALADFDAMATLADRVVLAFHRVCHGSLELGQGQLTAETKTVEFGLEGVFQVTVGVPVVDAAWPYAPSGTVPALTGKLKAPDGTMKTLTPA